MSSSTWFLHELASTFSNLPIALYAIGFQAQDGLVSAICEKAAAPMPFIGSIVDFKTIWNVKQSDLFGVLGAGGGKRYQVASLRHGNNFPLVNKAILTSAGLVERPLVNVVSDGTLPRAITVNISFLIPKTTPNKNSNSNKRSHSSAKLTGALIGCLELIIFVILAALQGIYGLYIGFALSTCLTITTLTYLILQQLCSPIFAHDAAIHKDIRLTAKNGAATDIHVITPDWNSDELYVLLGYSSQLHALTNIPARVSKPSLLKWTCRTIGLVLCVQAALLAKLIQAPAPAIYGSPIWLASTVSALAVRIVLKTCLWSEVSIPSGNLIQILQAPQILLPSRRAALALIASLPMTEPKVGKWEWADAFMPGNARREKWQREMDGAKLASPPAVGEGPEGNISDDGRRIIGQVRDVRCKPELLALIESFRTRIGIIS